LKKRESISRGGVNPNSISKPHYKRSFQGVFAQSSLIFAFVYGTIRTQKLFYNQVHGY